MAGRRQKVSDDDVFAAAQRAMSRLGPHELTLADIAEEAGVTPGRLVQRFGSKRAAAWRSERFAASAAPVFAGLRAAHGGPLATLRAYGVRGFGTHARGPAAKSRLPAGRPGRRGAPGTPRGERAREPQGDRVAGQGGCRRRALRREVDVRSLARTVETVIGGSLMSGQPTARGRRSTGSTKISKPCSRPGWAGGSGQERRGHRDRRQ